MNLHSKEKELQNHTWPVVKGFIYSFRFLNNFQLLPLHFLHFEGNMHLGYV